MMTLFYVIHDIRAALFVCCIPHTSLHNDHEGDERIAYMYNKKDVIIKNLQEKE